jgi:hypothetical protein
MPSRRLNTLAADQEVSVSSSMRPPAAPAPNGSKPGPYGGKRRDGGQQCVKVESVGSKEPMLTPTTPRRFADEGMKPARARIPDTPKSVE